MGLETLLFRKPVIVLMAIEDGVITIDLIKKVSDKVNYSTIVKILGVFEKLGLIKKKKEGRTKIIELTEKGKRIQGLLFVLSAELKSGK